MNILHSLDIMFYLAYFLEFAIACVLPHYLVESPNMQTVSGNFWQCTLFSNDKTQGEICLNLSLF